MSEMAVLAKILIERLTREQLHQVLEGVTAHYAYGACPLCGCQEVPFDGQGREIISCDVSRANWHEVHDEDCLVSCIEKSYSAKKRPTEP